MSFQDQLQQFWTDKRTRSVFSKCGALLGIAIIVIIFLGIALSTGSSGSYGRPPRGAALLAVLLPLLVCGPIVVAFSWTIGYFISMQPLRLQRISILVVAGAFLFSLFGGDGSWLRQYLDGSFQFLDQALYVAGTTAVAGVAMIGVAWAIDGFKEQT